MGNFGWSNFTPLLHSAIIGVLKDNELPIQLVYVAFGLIFILIASGISDKDGGHWKWALKQDVNGELERVFTNHSSKSIHVELKETIKNLDKESDWIKVQVHYNKEGNKIYFSPNSTSALFLGDLGIRNDSCGDSFNQIST